jgi:APA family basic amino acid/polyamine antiporter
MARHAAEVAHHAGGDCCRTVVVFGPDKTAFGKLVVFTAPYFYFFLCLTGLAVFVLRAKEPTASRPYRITLFPLPPIVFCLANGFMLYAGMRYAYQQAFVEVFWGVLVTLAGLLVIPFDRPIDHALPRDGDITSAGNAE